jgi:hypothetical protein
MLHRFGRLGDGPSEGFYPGSEPVPVVTVDPWGRPVDVPIVPDREDVQAQVAYDEFWREHVIVTNPSARTTEGEQGGINPDEQRLYDSLPPSQRGADVVVVARYEDTLALPDDYEFVQVITQSGVPQLTQPAPIAQVDDRMYATIRNTSGAIVPEGDRYAGGNVTPIGPAAPTPAAPTPVQNPGSGGAFPVFDASAGYSNARSPWDYLFGSDTADTPTLTPGDSAAAPERKGSGWVIGAAVLLALLAS